MQWPDGFSFETDAAGAGAAATPSKAMRSTVCPVRRFIATLASITDLTDRLSTERGIDGVSIDIGKVPLGFHSDSKQQWAALAHGRDKIEALDLHVRVRISPCDLVDRQFRT